MDLQVASNEDLALWAQGCSELTCLYHGEINAERRRRTTTPADVAGESEES